MKSLALVLMVLLFCSYVVSARDHEDRVSFVHHAPQAQARGETP